MFISCIQSCSLCLTLFLFPYCWNYTRFLLRSYYTDNYFLLFFIHLTTILLLAVFPQLKSPFFFLYVSLSNLKIVCLFFFFCFKNSSSFLYFFIYLLLTDGELRSTCANTFLNILIALETRLSVN